MTPDELYKNNLGLVEYCLNRYRTLDSDTVEDLRQEGRITLLKAARRYDPAKGYKFSTYATYYIRGRFLNYLKDTTDAIRVPRYKFNVEGARVKCFREFEAEYFDPPAENDPYDLAKDVTEAINRTVKNVRRRKMLIDHLVNERTSGEIGRELGVTAHAISEAKKRYLPDIRSELERTSLHPLVIGR
jgi:RNA polymerase sigma factor (sigma-70 family)